MRPLRFMAEVHLKSFTVKTEVRDFEFGFPWQPTSWLPLVVEFTNVLPPRIS